MAREVWRVPFPDWVTFASSSAVENLVSLIGVELLRDVKVASIGPVTSKTVLQCGLRIAAEAQPHSVDGLVDSIVHAVAPPKTA
jgi:uroporphyrinogen III methyltransferase/synthase